MTINLTNPPQKNINDANINYKSLPLAKVHERADTNSMPRQENPFKLLRNLHFHLRNLITQFRILYMPIVYTLFHLKDKLNQHIQS